MPATKALGKTLARAVAQIKTVSAIGSSRAFAGYKRWSESENYAALAQALTDESQGYASMWLSGLAGTGRLGAVNIEMQGELYFPIAKDTSSDLSTLWDVIEDIRQALENKTAYASGFEFAPASCTIRLRSLDLESLPAAIFEVEMICPAPGI
jgi:hypothetical protein